MKIVPWMIDKEDVEVVIANLRAYFIFPELPAF